MNKKTILVSGAGIAGLTLSYWLERYGYQVTVVERSPKLRLGGHNIEVNGSARKIAAMMGIEQDILAANTTEEGLKFVDKKNQVVASFPKDDTFSFTSELEILRGDLVGILYKCAKNKVAYLFDDFITDLLQEDEKVLVTFNSAKIQKYDLVVAADGVRSKTRKLMFGDEVKFRDIGLYTSYFTIPRQETDSNWARWYTATGSRVILLRPDNRGTTRAAFTFISKDKGYEDLSIDEKRRIFKENLISAGWESQRIVNGLEQDKDIYFDKLSQVMAPRWANGRLVMTGDAAYCPTAITGMGTALAMVGAYILAGELFVNSNHSVAFLSYEKRMRPYVNSAQQLPPGIPKLLYPRTVTGVFIINKLASFVSSKLFQFCLKLFTRKKKRLGKQEIFIPAYAHSQL